jgi:hypothetical protein
MEPSSGGSPRHAPGERGDGEPDGGSLRNLAGSAPLLSGAHGANLAVDPLPGAAADGEAREGSTRWVDAQPSGVNGIMPPPAAGGKSIKGKRGGPAAGGEGPVVAGRHKGVSFQIGSGSLNAPRGFVSADAHPVTSMFSFQIINYS